MWSTTQGQVSGLCVTINEDNKKNSSVFGKDFLSPSTGDFTRRGWLYFNQSFYRIPSTKRNWTASRKYCLQRNTDMVVINSKEEQVTEALVCVCVCIFHSFSCVVMTTDNITVGNRGLSAV